MWNTMRWEPLRLEDIEDEGDRGRGAIWCGMVYEMGAAHLYGLLSCCSLLVVMIGCRFSFLLFLLLLLLLLLGGTAWAMLFAFWMACFFRLSLPLFMLAEGKRSRERAGF